MHIVELWRYPVKSMGGERLTATVLTADGIPGDRIVQVRNIHERVISARRAPGLLGFQGTLSTDGIPLINGRRWDAPEALDDVRRAAGRQAQLLYDADPDTRFDVLPLLAKHCRRRRQRSRRAQLAWRRGAHRRRDYPR